MLGSISDEGLERVKNEPCDDLLRLSESQLSRFAFEDFRSAPILYEQLGLPSARTVYEVQDPFVRGTDTLPGDVDVFLCDPLVPDRAVVFECKRVRVRSFAFETDMMGLRGLNRGVLQANGLRSMGFAESYLLVFVAVDGRERTMFNFVGRGLTNRLAGMILEKLESSRLCSEVGIVLVELVQPVEKGFGQAGGVGVHDIRRAQKQMQPTDLTETIRGFLADR